MARPLPICIKDTREPDMDAGDAEDAVFSPCIFAPGQPRDLPFADRRRIALPYERRGLSEGDYAPKGLEGVVGIERKSGLDMLATCFGDSGLDSCGEQMANLDRFREEMRRVCAARYELFIIVSEESRGWYFTEAKRRWQRYGKAFDPFRLFDIIDSFLVDCGVPTLWCGSRGLAEVDVGRILVRAAGWAEGGKSWDSKAAERGYAPPWARVVRGRGLRLPWMMGEEASDVGTVDARELRAAGPGGSGVAPDDAGLPGEDPRDCDRGGVGSARVPGEREGDPATTAIGCAGCGLRVGNNRGVVQSAEQRALTPRVAGSSPAAPTDDGDDMPWPTAEGQEPHVRALSKREEEARDDRDSDEVRSVRSIERDGGLSPVPGDVGEGEDESAAVARASQMVGEHPKAEKHLCGAGLSGEGRAVRSDADPPVAPPCSCGTLALPSPHVRAAPGCCHSATPQPAPVVGGQERASLDGASRIVVKRRTGGLTWRYEMRGEPGGGFALDAAIIAGWPVLCNPVAPVARTAAPDAGVTRILAERGGLLGVALTHSEHQRRKAARRRGRVAP